MITKRQLQDMIDGRQPQDFSRVAGELMCLLQLADAVKGGVPIEETQALVASWEKL